MPEQMSLGEILSTEEPVKREPAPKAEPEKSPDAAKSVESAPPEKPAVDRVQSKKKEWQDREAVAHGKVRDPDTGQFVSPKEAPAEAAPVAPIAEPAKPAPAAPQQEFTDREKAFLRATQEERGKRQKLEERIAAIEAGKAQPGASTEPAKTFWEDPDGALAKQRADAAKHLEDMERVSTNARLNTAEQIARSRHPDFEEKLAIFGEILEKNPAMARSWLSSRDPAEFAYTTAKNHQELQQAGGIDALRAKIEKETEAKVRVKVEAELKAKAEALEKERAALPGSLSDARSSGGNKPVWGGPPSLDSVLKL